MSLRRLAAVVFAAALAAPAGAQQARITATAPDGTPTTIRLAPGTRQDAQALLKQYLPLPQGSELVATKTTKGGKDIATQRFAQWLGGHRVEHGNYIVASRSGEALYMRGRIFTNVAGGSAASIAEGDALQAALAAVPAQLYRWQSEKFNNLLRRQTNRPDTTYYPTGSLVWIQDFSTPPAERSTDLHLAYRFDIFAEKPMAHQVVYVDAATGNILFKNNLIHHVAISGASLYSGVLNMEGTATGGTYRLEDYSRGDGVFTLNYDNSTDQADAIDVTSNSSVFIQDPAVDAHWGAEMVYDYWMQEHGRASYDDQDGALYSFVHYSEEYDNAFWDGGSMNYGDGGNFFTPLTSMDVCGHEIGHGVCQETAGLIYEAESGALNEGFSDIWGATIEHWSDPNEVDATAKQYWSIGEEISSVPMRRMDNPAISGQPDTYEGSNYVPTTGNCDGDNDQCGVHTNSGVLNYWYYLLVEGGSGTNDNGNVYFVNGIDWTDASQIAYLAEQSMSSTDGFAEAREASIAAANALFGACSPQEEATTRAWYAVGVGADYPPCAPTIAFPANDSTITEWAPGTTCGTSRVVTMPVILQGPAPTGGDAVMTATVTGGTAVRGLDFDMIDTVATFDAGSTAPQFFTMRVFDNGIIGTTKSVNLAMSVASNGSNATASVTLQTMSVVIQSDDRRPDTGITLQTIVGTDDGTESNYSSAFFGSAARARSQFIIPAATLLAEGVQPGRAITAISFDVVEKNSTLPYSGYTLSMGHTTAGSYSGAFLNAGTEVFSGTVTTALGWNVLTLQTPFVWNGTDNLVVQACFSNTDDNTSNDRVRGENLGGTNLTAYASSDATGVGCTMAWTNNTSPARPLMRFTQPLPPTPVETVAGDAHDWRVSNGQEVYFYSTADSQVIAGFTAANKPVGCVQTTLTHAGVGFEPAVFGTYNRSIKEVMMTPEMNVDSASYSAFLYFTTAELDGKNPADLRMVRTTAATDAEINSTNMQIVTPIVLKSTPWTRFRATFVGFGRYFLIDNASNGIGASAAALGAGGLAVAGNPFTDALRIRASLSKPANAAVRLTDITGKTVISTTLNMAAGQQYYSIPVAQYALPAGTYLLQVVTGEGVLQEKVVKQ